MWARLLADAAVVLHVLFVLFALFGGLLVLYRRGFLWLHLPAAIWAVMIELFGWFCPLTDLENALRRKAGQAGYSGGFIEHYVLPVLYPAGLTREVQYALAAVALGINVAVYAWVVRSRRRRGAG